MGRNLKLAVTVCAALLLGGAAPRVTQPVIVLVSIDTLRADHVGAYGWREKTTPFLDELAARGTLFENDLVPLPLTGPSHASLLTGSSPWKHGVGVNGVTIAKDVDSLPAALHRAGYYTAGVVAVSHLGAACGFERGFDRFSEPEYAQRLRDNRRDAARENEAAMAAVDEYLKHHRSQPLFLFVHYFDCHAPYRWWDLPRGNPAGDDTKDPRQPGWYDDGVRHTDAYVRRLHDYLGEKGLLGNTAFVVTADHGEQLGDHGLYYEHGDIYRETVRVPLIITGPGFPHRRVAETVSSMDVAPTLVRIGGAQLQGRVSGLDLKPAIDRAALVVGWLAGSTPRRPLVVQGAANYTRSLALIEGSRWFIKNFDFIYRDAWIASPAPDRDRPGVPVEQSERDAEKVVYRIPMRDYRPHMLTIEHVAASPNCGATALLKILPTAQYFTPITFQRSIRFVVPSARLDSVALIVQPPACAGKTFFDVARMGEAKLPPVQPRVTDLYGHLLAPRKRHTGDELYDVKDDPAMLRPIKDATEMAARSRELADRFRELASHDPANLAIPEEEQKLLRSMGYIQ